MTALLSYVIAGLIGNLLGMTAHGNPIGTLVDRSPCLLYDCVGHK